MSEKKVYILMEKQPLEDLLPRANGSMYGLVRMASVRSLEIADGKPPLVEGISTDKATTIALQEILEGKVESKEAAEQRSNDEKKQKDK